jgi:hypothetical protein
MKLSNTIVILETSGEDILSLHTFTPDEAGQAEAEKLFGDLAKKQIDYDGDNEIPMFSDAQIAEGWKEGFLIDEFAVESGCDDAWVLTVCKAEE